MALEAIIILAILMFIDIFFTQVLAKLYRKIYPKDKKWYEHEWGLMSNIFYKKFGLKWGYYLSYIKIPIVCLVLYIIDSFLIDLRDLELILIGAFLTVIFYHCGYYRDFQKKLKHQNTTHSRR